jgi:hypothetical protein
MVDLEAAAPYELGEPPQLQLGTAKPTQIGKRPCAFENSTYCLAVVGEPFGGTGHKELSDSLLRHHRGGSAAGCDGLRDFPLAHSIDNASRLARALRGIAGGKPLAQA